MSYRILGFLECWISYVISISAGLPVTATPKVVTELR